MKMSLPTDQDDSGDLNQNTVSRRHCDTAAKEQPSNMEVQLLLESLATNLRTSLAQFAALNGNRVSRAPGELRGAGDTTTSRADLERKLFSAWNIKDVETRTSNMKSDIALLALKPARTEKMTIYVHCLIQKIGEIETVAERFYAEIQINSRWREPKLDGLKKNSVDLFPNWDDHWNPDLAVINAFSGVREQVAYYLSYDNEGKATVQERRQLRGNFSEQLELWNYPFDVQELTVKLQSSHDDSEVALDRDPETESRVNRETFTNRQQWTLSKTVRVWSMAVSDSYSHSSRIQPTLCMACIVKRKAEFFIWNIILIMICICSMIFTTFTIEPGVATIGGRLALSFFILLSNITFKFSVSSTIPKVPYLTYLDRYIVFSMIHLCLVCIWHAITILLTDNVRHVDVIAFIVLLSCYVIFNVIWAIKSKYLSRKRKNI